MATLPYSYPYASMPYRYAPLPQASYSPYYPTRAPYPSFVLPTSPYSHFPPTYFPSSEKFEPSVTHPIKEASRSEVVERLPKEILKEPSKTPIVVSEKAENEIAENRPEAEPVITPSPQIQPSKNQDELDTFSQQTGRKVGDMVTRLLEENPQWEKALSRINLDTLLDDPHSFVYRIRGAYQDSRLLKFITQQFSKPIIKALPDDMEPGATQLLNWLDQKAPELAPVLYA